MSLVEASEARKARLLALRKRKAGESDDVNGSAVDAEPMTLKHRNFDPDTRTQRKHTTNGADAPEDTVEYAVAGLQERIIADDEARRDAELDILTIAPKRANWDLKRDMERKLAKLERQTQEAIVILTRRRIAAQKGEGVEDLAGALDAQMRHQEAAGDSDED
ncbi:mRNA splicing factor [Auriculariales sp. MPI-PUGE-AT-0066]|nr:mRNA splicing factor [Auriculariales sp. MPI-PUGE-AT-0066]